MDRRISNATSSLASAALKLCTELANYWRTVLADQRNGIVPSCTMRGPARSGARPTPVYAIRDKLVSRSCRSGWRLKSWHCSSGSREGSPRTTPY